MEGRIQREVMVIFSETCMIVLLGELDFEVQIEYC